MSLRRPAAATAAPDRPSQTVRVSAWLLGERLDTRALEGGSALASTPLAVAIDGGGTAVVFRYGAIVLFDGPATIVERFLDKLAPLLTDRLVIPEREELRLLIRPDAEQPVDAAGNIILRDQTIESLQLVADVLAKNLVLSHYETRVAAMFDRIEPLAKALRETGRAGVPGKTLLQHIGSVLEI